MNKAWLLLGGNMGDKILNLSKAKKLLQEQVGKIIRSSSIYETASWGELDQPAFLNQVLIIKTTSNAEKIMDQILLIESELGRIRTHKNASRIIDIDILFFNEEIIQSKNLIIPHPEIQNRNFVLYPLNEISPQLLHPVLKKTVHELFLSCPDTLEVKPFLANTQ